MSLLSRKRRIALYRQSSSSSSLSSSSSSSSSSTASYQVDTLLPFPSSHQNTCFRFRCFTTDWTVVSNSLLSGCPQWPPNKHQKVQNNAARLVLRSPGTDTLNFIFAICTGFQSMLESNKQIYSGLCFGAIPSTGPVYRSDLLKIYTPSRQLRSSADSRVLRVPPVYTASCVFFL